MHSLDWNHVSSIIRQIRCAVIKYPAIIPESKLVKNEGKKVFEVFSKIVIKKNEKAAMYCVKPIDESQIINLFTSACTSVFSSICLNAVSNEASPTMLLFTHILAKDC